MCGWVMYWSGEPFTYHMFNTPSSVLVYQATLNLSVYNTMWHSQYMEKVELWSHKHTDKEFTMDCNMVRECNKTQYVSKHTTP